VRSFLLVLLLLSAPAQAEVYRWIDANGVVHYSSTPPPQGAKADRLNLDASPGNVAQATHPRRELDEAPAVAQATQAAAAPAEPRGLEFRKLVTLRVGMTEGEVLAIAGPPDAQSRSKSSERLTYLPTRADPFVTTITLRNGRVSTIDQARQF
jgi:hypothetical protein